MAYPEKMTREENEMCEVYARFRLDGCSRDESIRYMVEILGTPDTVRVPPPEINCVTDTIFCVA